MARRDALRGERRPSRPLGRRIPRRLYATASTPDQGLADFGP